MSTEPANDKSRDSGRSTLNPNADEVYQFTCTGCMGSATTVRVIRRREEVMLISHLHRRYAIEELDAKLLSVPDWNRLLEKLRKVHFGTLPENLLRLGLDGEDWVVEGRRADEYHRVMRWSPDEGP